MTTMISTSSEKLGRFGHHPHPADDYLIEVESLIGASIDRAIGYPEPDFERRLDRAMAFKVGGDPHCVAARRTLVDLAFSQAAGQA